MSIWEIFGITGAVNPVNKSFNEIVKKIAEDYQAKNNANLNNDNK